ncbi:MAG: tRNA pseudouridine(54/55) synthase Pus10 [Candidatus Anstonellales archaeon]
MMVVLCRFCNERFKKKFKEGECYICKGNVEKIIRNVEKVDIKLPVKNAESFSISTAIPKEVVLREEDVFDIVLGESIKSWLNAKVVEILAKKTKLKYKATYSDVNFTIDWSGNVFASVKNLFIFGRYKKYSNEISQSKGYWKGKGSVEESIGEVMEEECEGTRHSLHASGREDVDALNFAGRPFVMEIYSAKERKPDLEKIKRRIDETGVVEVSDLRIVDGSAVAIITDSHFDKRYRAYLSEELSEGQKKKIKECIEGKIIEQWTPKRVERRRAKKIRKRKVYSIDFGEDGEGQYAEVEAEAGTYIKELINGDEGRTKPSFSEILGKPLECKKLIVVAIKDDFIRDVVG